MANKPRPARIVCEAQDPNLKGRIDALAERLGLPAREIVEAVLARSTDDDLTRHVRIWRVRNTTLEDV